MSTFEKVSVAQLFQDQGGHFDLVPAARAGRVPLRARRAARRARRAAVRPRRRHRAPRLRGRVWSLHRVRYKRGAVVPLQRPHGARRGLARRRQLQALHTLLHPQGTVAVTPIPTSILTILTLVHSD